ncbi:Type III restriction enzyme, res subunit [Nocardioides terrae]|uniref:Type III restriction enzyme, res subunit n=1 Tax=Nocardioides terrae TaxID=574651 RepID=A0A1I1L1N0_9ACTN|nr:DEAD/DEAH box helicase family protein [Nocardioides terrae]SFC66956.1 Type III restriction enzyme, res subunit [Nocardioides terrae]
MSGLRLRTHQRRALEALDAAWATERTRSWVVLPPGAGKTLVGLETARRLLSDGRVAKVVVLGPNTAISGQWVDQAAVAGVDAGDDRGLARPLTSLTYQSLAVFDADREVSEEGREEQLLARLHDNGRALVERLRDVGPLLLVLDECHHLLEVWGRLLAEVLDELPDARVLGLTATPPDALTSDEAELVGELFGTPVFETSIPAVVREGDLAPFAELVWLTEPTAAEKEWLAESALRFTELVTALTDPSFGSVPFLTWADRRFVERPGDAPSWAGLATAEPDLAAAALRLHHAGLLALPPGGVMTEEHRRDPTADDWVRLLDDWTTGALLRSEDPADKPVLDGLRRALPSVGHVLTRRGIRPGRSPVDRVLARSEAKTSATAEIVRLEHLALGDRLRLLVLCDHEHATATLPADLDGVLSEQAGSAYAALGAVLPEAPDALLVTGATVAGAPRTLAALVDHIAASEPDLAAALTVEDGPVASLLVGPWSSRRWTRHVTRFFEAGGCHVLVGTRGLLGEGWDARRVTGVVDLTTVTTTTAVVQTRGRALRIDPSDPEKVAINWSLVCVAEHHPRGDNDWLRLVRKHSGFFGVDEDGTVVDGVGHIDPAFSPYAPPPAADFDRLNARMAVRAEDRDGIRERWQVGTPYDDLAGRTLRIRPERADALGTTPGPPAVVVREQALEVRAATRPGFWARFGAGAGVPVGWAAAVAAVPLGVVSTWTVLAGALTVPAAYAGRAVSRRDAGRRLLDEARRAPSIAQMASAVADALHAAGSTGAGADRVGVEVEPDGEYRVHLAGATEPESALFATSLEEVLAPLSSPRYVVPRWVVSDRARGWRELARIGSRKQVPADGVVWHAVPTTLGTRAENARRFADAWDHWVGGGPALYTGSPEGAGVLAAQRGSDPFDVTTVIRRHWS